ncbi:hypothetical protein [Streptomyces sp. NPDC057438]|uniref:hypothetical protein n=1 Tax=Streptomyces sp. NPDC057438 TaxID=3346133 RepID=UPI00367E6B1E
MVGARLERAAIDFCKSLGVELLCEWTVCRLTGEPLTSLAAQAPPVVRGAPATESAGRRALLDVAGNSARVE